MKRLHIHLFVTDINTSISFYNHLFATSPTLRKDDYARWELRDPALNFAISNHGTPGIDHLGLQVASSGELTELVDTINNSQQATLQLPATTSCCYARSDKTWHRDPQGIEWELFYTQHNENEFFGADKNSDCCR